MGAVDVVAPVVDVIVEVEVDVIFNLVDVVVWLVDVVMEVAVGKSVSLSEGFKNELVDIIDEFAIHLRQNLVEYSLDVSPLLYF